MKRNPVSVEIGGVSLTGFSLSAHQTGLVRHGMERELWRLLRVDGLPPNDVHERTLAAPALGLTATSAAPAELGRQIARSVYLALNGKV
jgi:hypothetical protein